MQAVCSSETLISTCKAIRRYNQEAIILNEMLAYTRQTKSTLYETQVLSILFQTAPGITDLHMP
jgi:hypothetical protein